MTKIDPQIWMKSWDKHVKNNLEYPTESLGTLYARVMEKFPDRPAFWMLKREISFREMSENVEKFATFLQQNGIKKGDIVAINLPNCPQYLFAHFGALLAGAAVSGVNPLMSEREVSYQLNDSKAKVIVTLDAIYDKRLRKILDETPNLEIIVATNLSEYMGLSSFMVFLAKLLKKIPKGKISDWPGKKVVKFLDIMENTVTDVKKVNIDVDKDLALLQYTGGTTGFPKGTELTHSNMITQHTLFTHWLDMEYGAGKEIVISAFPMFHLAGLMVASEALWVAGSQILIPNPRDTDHLIEEMENKKPTIMANVPSLYGMIMNNPKSKDIPNDVLDNINVYVSGAAPFPAEMINDFERHMKAENKVMELYGMTETSPVSVCNPYLGKKKIGKVGLPLPDTQLKIVDIDSGNEVGVGEVGELLFKGGIVTRGYLNKPEATKQTIEDGWIHTGDVGVMDEDGYIQIVDRIKDMLIVSGYKVYSVHVEDVLNKQPDIDLVAIVGLEDEKRPGSEIVKAYVKLKPGIEQTEVVEEKIKKFATENLSKYEVPRLWEFREELPLTVVGKVLKKALRED
ncbi:MAG: AMP-binding protein [Candidatus Hodarchaeales archaeon]